MVNPGVSFDYYRKEREKEWRRYYMVGRKREEKKEAQIE